jgi:hypothetical protein
MVKIALRQVFVERKRFLFTTSALLGSGLAATIGGLALAGAGTAAAMSMGGQKKSSSSSAIPSLPPLGQAPGAGTEATAAEKARIRKKTKTILTSPLKGDEFGTGPTLLGSGTGKTTLGG